MIDDVSPGKGTKSLQTKLDTYKKAAPTFQTPEEVAARDDISEQPEDAVVDTVEAEADQVAPEATKQPGALRRALLKWPFGKREWLTSGVVVVLVSGVIVGVILNHVGTKPVAKAEPIKAKVTKKVAAATPTTVPSTLSGLPVDPSLNQKPVTGVMIENSTDARPQAGLSQAGVVFEAIAEGGITRFLALFQDTTPNNVGPIRSARPYYVQWALGFDAGYAHVGGSPEALADIKAWGARDLDQFANGGSYHRISSRAAPHNVYTGIDTLNQLESAKGYTTSKYTGFVRKAKEQPAKVPTNRSINFSISGPVYSVHYDYDAKTNSYSRSEGGAAHVDSNTNTQISPKVVIALVMPYHIESDGYHSDYSTIGKGQAVIYQDGTSTLATWSKTSATSQFTFTDAKGKTIGLNPGQTWLTAVSDASKISSSP